MIPYEGSTHLQFLVPYVGLELDKINFVVGLLASLIFAVGFRRWMSPATTSPFVRHAISAAVGLSLLTFCFGRQSLHILFQTIGCYFTMKLAPSRIQHGVTFVFAMSYLSAIHIQRMIFNSSGDRIELSGPLMICTQKLTSLAFSLHDGSVKDRETLTPEQRHLAVGRPVDFLRLASLVTFFPTILGGPHVTYNEFIEFMEGREEGVGGAAAAASAAAPTAEASAPSPTPSVLRKLALAGISLGVVFVLPAAFPVHLLINAEFSSLTFFSNLALTQPYMALHRARYYFVFLMTDAACNAAGFGRRYDAEKGAWRWDGATNIDVVRIETALNMKGITDHWNKRTAVWLRRVCYERTTKYRVLKTFVLSALWHGFYPGYYLTFLQLSLLVQVSRHIRRRIRPFFVQSATRKFLYDVITWFTTNLFLAYAMFPFSVLHFDKSINYYKSLRFALHFPLGLVLLSSLIPCHETNNVKNEANENERSDETNKFGEKERFRETNDANDKSKTD